MKKLNEEGRYTVSDELKQKLSDHFSGLFCGEEDTAKEIERTFHEDEYLIDTHTAVAVSCAKRYMEKNPDGTKMLIASTASPYKFAADVYKSITGNKPEDELSALEELSKLSGVAIPYPLADIDKREIRFREVISKEEMPANVKAFALGK